MRLRSTPLTGRVETHAAITSPPRPFNRSGRIQTALLVGSLLFVSLQGAHATTYITLYGIDMSSRYIFNYQDQHLYDLVSGLQVEDLFVASNGTILDMDNNVVGIVSDTPPGGTTP